MHRTNPIVWVRSMGVFKHPRNGKSTNIFLQIYFTLKHTNIKLYCTGQLGRQRLQCLIKQRMVNFWSHLITGKASKISCTLFHIIKDKIVSGTYTSKWLTEVENTLHECGLSYILNTPTSQILPRSIKLLVKDKIGLMENQDWHSRIF